MASFDRLYTTSYQSIPDLFATHIQAYVDNSLGLLVVQFVTKHVNVSANQLTVCRSIYLSMSLNSFSRHNHTTVTARYTSFFSHRLCTIYYLSSL